MKFNLSPRQKFWSILVGLFLVFVTVLLSLPTELVQFCFRMIGAFFVGSFFGSKSYALAKKWSDHDPAPGA